MPCVPPGTPTSPACKTQTVVTNAFKGEDLNHYVPLFRKYGVPVLYNFKESDMRWSSTSPRHACMSCRASSPTGFASPDYFLGRTSSIWPTVKCHIYTTTTGAMKNAFGGLLATHRHLHHSWIHRTLVDSVGYPRRRFIPASSQS